MGKKILLIGGGGHCKAVIDCLLEKNTYDKIGIIDTKKNIGKQCLNVDMIGCDDDLPTLYGQGYTHAFITIGSMGDATKRVRLYQQIKKMGFEVPFIASQTADIGLDVKIEEGVFVGKHVVINASSIIKTGAIINTGAIIEHDCTIHSFAHIAPGCVLCGGVTVEQQSHIGANTTVKQNVTIGKNTLVGMGSVVIHNLNSNQLAYGNPCKIKGER